MFLKAIYGHMRTHTECGNFRNFPILNVHDKFVKDIINVNAISDVANLIIEGAHIFIYSCSAQLISFEIDCFYAL